MSEPLNKASLDLIQEWAEEAQKGGYDHVSMLSPDAVLALIDAALPSPETTPAGVLPDEMRREIEALPEPLVWQDNVSRAAVLEIVDQRTPAGVLDEAALREALNEAHKFVGRRSITEPWSDADVALVVNVYGAAALGRSGSGGGRG